MIETKLLSDERGKLSKDVQYKLLSNRRLQAAETVKEGMNAIQDTRVVGPGNGLA